MNEPQVVPNPQYRIDAGDEYRVLGLGRDAARVPAARPGYGAVLSSASDRHVQDGVRGPDRRVMRERLGCTRSGSDPQGRAAGSWSWPSVLKMSSPSDALFEEKERSNPSPASHLEGTYRFLDRVSGAYWGQVRGELDRWISHVETDARKDLLARFRSGSDDQFNSAYLELYLHEMFLRSGCSVECHPEIGDRRPDFRVACGRDEFYVEATHLVHRSDEAVGRGRRTAAIYDALNTVDSPNFFVWVEVDASGPDEVAKRPLVEATQTWLSTLDPDTVDAAMRVRGLDAMPTTTWTRDGWTIRLRPIPKVREARGEPGVRPIGVYGSTGAQLVDGASPIRKALRRKGSAYRINDAPFVVALGVDWVTGKDDRDMTCALYGSEQIVFDIGEGRALGTQRAADGYWFAGDRWTHTNVSAVLQITNLHPAFFQRSAPTLWIHPSPDHQPQPLPVWRSLRPEGSSMTDLPPKIELEQLFGLPEEWPTGEPFPDDK